MADGIKGCTVFFLCGQKGAGKTFFGKKIAEKTDFIHIDLDDAVLELNRNYTSCRQLFREKGEEYFRKQELSALERVISSLENGKKYIISLGGGSCESPGLMELAKKHGKMIFLDQSEETLLERTVSNGIPPYLEGNTKDLFRARFERRQNLYSFFADYVIELSDCTEIQAEDRLLGLIED